MPAGVRSEGATREPGPTKTQLPRPQRRATGPREGCPDPGAQPVSFSRVARTSSEHAVGVGNSDTVRTLVRFDYYERRTFESRIDWLNFHDVGGSLETPGERRARTGCRRLW